ncbi:hypothetical protein DEJ25_12735 [Curtobacterium sp. MCPF17_011]|uniref:hypothetical protein n=1 Tax=Curtobacterium sp. MCPF17_011 TaxID=2175652 RepID=UPI000DA90B99|nr:hypothetical protein [Curtobacterium sp. MCPF17_011]PZF10684.1 hypothetical protein DEJ25_12735 [Curtobacterium sp. MCPF17_011]
MTAKPTPFAPQIAALLSPQARRELPSLATRSAVRTVPLEAIAPMARRAWAAVTADERRAHVERLALRLVAEDGAEIASSKIAQYVAATHGDKVAQRTSPPAPLKKATANVNPLPTPTPTAEDRPAAALVGLGYCLPCSCGCGAWSFTGSPRPARKLAHTGLADGTAK